MGIAPAIDLTADQRRTVVALLNRHLPNTTVWAYGSRVKWTSHPASDLDLVAFAKPEQAARLTELREVFDESSLPFSVDLFVWNDVPKDFRKRIETEHVVLVKEEKRMHSEWPMTTLGTVVNNLDSRRVPLSRRERELRYGKYPYYGATGVMGYVDDFLFEGPHVLVAEDGSVEQRDGTPFTQFVRGKFWVNNHAHVLTGETDQDTRYLYYAISTVAIRPYVSGSVQAKLSQANLNRIPIPYPDAATRRATLGILGALDDKIELNHRMNETLEAMARALFKSWFVDFDPVRAKMEGCDIGVSEDIAALFPNRLVESQLGYAPEGWSIGCIADIAGSPRRTVNPSELPSDLPYIGLEHMPRQSIALADWGEAGNVKSGKSKFEKGDILFGKLRPYFHKVGVAPLGGVCSTDIVAITPNKPHWTAFLLACVSSTEFVAYVNQASTGTKMPRTSWKTMSDYQFFLPAKCTVRAFQNLVQPMLDRIIANAHESRALASQRDALLPKLMSGRVKV